MIQQRQQGTTRLNTLRREDLEARFPGLLETILQAAGEPGRRSAVECAASRLRASARSPHAPGDQSAPRDRALHPPRAGRAGPTRRASRRCARSRSPPARRWTGPTAPSSRRSARRRSRSRRSTSARSVTDHDMAAFVDVLSASAGPAGRWIHYGLTSCDVLDTGLALQLRRVGELVVPERARLVRGAGATRARARRHAVRRAHARDPRRADDVRRQARRLRVRGRPQRRSGWSARSRRPRSARSRAPSAPTRRPRRSSRRRVLARLGLGREPVSTQVVARDRHAELLEAIALAGAGLERFATEIRHLARTEVGEVREPFGAGQKGSSSMPHKRNPIKSEQVAGLARVLRGNAQAALENVALWHERDISHSSVERIILPDSTSLLDHMQRRVLALVRGDGRRRRADAREPRADPRGAVLPAGAAGAGARGVDARRRLPDRPAAGAAGARRAHASCASCWRRIRPAPGSTSTRSSTTAPFIVLRRARSSRGSTRSSVTRSGLFSAGRPGEGSAGPGCAARADRAGRLSGPADPGAQTADHACSAGFGPTAPAQLGVTARRRRLARRQLDAGRGSAAARDRRTAHPSDVGVELNCGTGQR